MFTKQLVSNYLTSNVQCYFQTVRCSLIETHELYQLIKQKEPIKILQAGFIMPNVIGHPNSIYQKKRIPGAQLFELKGILDQNAKYPNTLASIEQIANYMKNQNLKKNDTFVIYDDFGIVGACRVWWTFQLFGIKNAYILNGSSIKWKNEKLPFEVTTPKSITPSKEIENFEFNSNLIVDKNQVKQISQDILSNIGGFEIVDARPPKLFSGKQPEFRKGVRTGNIPGSKNLFCNDTFNTDWSFKSNEELKQLFTKKGINLKNRIINSCGSGMTATILNFAEELIGVKNKAVYDGSWTEFGSISQL